MSKKLNNNELRSIGFYELELVKVAGQVAKNLVKNNVYTKEQLLDIYKELLAEPEKYLQHEHFARVAAETLELQPPGQLPPLPQGSYELRKEPLPYRVYGAQGIEQGALGQMNTAMKLPVALAGALMPDAHHGYGLPIGGVLATQSNVVIPYAVGVDIACRMCLSVFDMDAKYLEQKQQQLTHLLGEHTMFGIDSRFKQPLAEDLFDRQEWNATPVIRSLKAKAMAQVGTSGTGNHFVEWGIIEIEQESPDLPLAAGRYLALLSHSGSRGFGAGVANYYSKLAMEKTKLPKEAQHLAWLDLNSEEGQEYWMAMNLAGDYASVNHHHIHKRLSRALGEKPAVMVENHHNFAWKEKLADGTEVIMHRKGATPAGETDLGIIPGSMAAPGFVVKGKGNPDSLFSASHGAGRVMSRSQALRSLVQSDVKKLLADKGVKLIGGALDEAPMVYKDIHKVLEFQSDLLTVLARFTPKIVRMADPDKRSWARED